MQKFHPKTAEYTLFSSGHRKLFRINHMLGHKASLSTFRKTKIIINIFFDHSFLNSMQYSFGHQGTDNDIDSGTGPQAPLALIQFSGFPI